MMTDHDKRDFYSEDPLEGLASDLWAITKAHSAMSNEEQFEAWMQAVPVLHDFGKLAETLHNDALLLAVTDAKDRAEELDRAFDRLNRCNGEQLRSREEKRLRAMIARCDALSNAYQTVLREEWVCRANQEETLATLKELLDEANEAFRRYRLEVGLPEPEAYRDAGE